MWGCECPQACVCVYVFGRRKERDRKRQPLEVPPLDPRLLLVILAFTAISWFVPRSLSGLKQTTFDLLTFCCYICVGLCVRVAVCMCSSKIEILYWIDKGCEACILISLELLYIEQKSVYFLSVLPHSPAPNPLTSLLTVKPSVDIVLICAF